MRTIVLLLPLLACAACVPLLGQRGYGDVYQNVVFSDVFDITVTQIDRDYEIWKADAEEGVIESAWDFDSVSPGSRLLRREKVIARVAPVEDGIELVVRVRTQVRERTGLLAPDDQSDVGWSDAEDDDERAAVVFQRIRSALVRGRPSEEFEERKPIFEEPVE